jgi:Amt family ammonium transporter
VGGISGMLLTAVFANKNINSAIQHNGLLFGETKLFFTQLIAIVGVSLFAFVGTIILLKITDLISPLRATESEEEEGLDWSQHGEKL